MRLLLPFTAAFVLAVVSAGTALAAIVYSEPFPSGRVGYAYPPVGMRVIATGDDDLTAAEIVLDGVVHTPRRQGSLLVHVPATPLAPGRHAVEMRVAFTGRQAPLSRKWEFEVVPGALQALPSGGTPQADVLDEINRWRREADLLPVAHHGALTSAAASHARYVLTHPSEGTAVHDESPDKDGFTGEKPWQRGMFFGYPYYYHYENVHFLDDHRRAVRAWLDSVYHRLPLIDPGVREIGYGFVSNNQKTVNVLESATTDPPGVGEDLAEPLARSAESGVLVISYPIPGQRDVPTRWEGLEEPDPYRSFPGARPAGYPITVQFLQPEVASSTVIEASLRDDQGRTVPVWLLTPQNDAFLAPNIALLPVNDLLPGQRYTVLVVGEVKLGDNETRPFRKEWRFTTAGQTEVLLPEPGISVFLNGQRLVPDVPPALKNDRTMVPVRALLEALGATVSWDGLRYDVLAEMGERLIFLKVGNDRAVVDGREAQLDAAPYIARDRVLVPVRFVAESLGLNVEWDNAKRAVRIAVPDRKE